MYKKLGGGKPGTHNMLLCK